MKRSNGSMNINQWTINDLEQSIKALLLDYPELNDDEELKQDMLHGSTKFIEVMEKLLLTMMEKQVLRDALGEFILALRLREATLEKRIAFLRSLMHRLMTATDTKSLDLPAAKLTVKSTPAKVVISDEDVVPVEFFRVKRELNKAAIKAALEDGKEVPGANLSNGGTTIQVR